MTIVVAGHICVDLTPTLDAVPQIADGALRSVGPMSIRLGGSVANAARAFRFLGQECRVSACVGSDALGGLVLRLLADEGVDSAGMEIDERVATSYSIVFEAPSRDRSFWHHAGANDAYLAAAVDFAGVDALHVGYPSLLAALRADEGWRLSELFRSAQDAGVLTSLDLAVVDPGSAAAATDWGTLLSRVLPHTDVVSPSIDDLRSIADAVEPSWKHADASDLAAALVGLGAGVALVSAGLHGVHLAAAGRERLSDHGAIGPDWADAREFSPAAPVTTIVSTNGAGDATSAGLVSAVLLGAGPGEAAAAASAAGGAAVSGRLRITAGREGES